MLRELEERLYEHYLQANAITQTGRIVYLQRSLRKFVIVMCLMIEIQDLEGVRKDVLIKRTNIKKNLVLFVHVSKKEEKRVKLFTLQVNSNTAPLVILCN